MSGWLGLGSKAAAWPHRLDQLEKKLTGFIEAQTKTNGELIQLIHELRVDLTKLEGTIRETVSEAGRAAAATTAQMTHQIHSDMASVRERLARMEAMLESSRRPSPDGPGRPKLSSPP
ncbi:hypothetical protein [Roseicella aquatilis]|uniref:Uncharacterized protein n=1 Tax=Roseicella aquatilis TaxID=2527868 RepID=A0A4R4DGP5_9PROT|nr:hypothetical protein [Roseicella aquatilis]TCZ58747.1 hypothetical protein EXY23_16175 [Roseicella aquatilis]